MADDTQKLIDELERWGAEPKQVLTDTFMDDMDFYEKCLRMFCKENSLQALRDSLVPAKKDDSIRAAHTMKGNADYLGLFPVMDAAMTILSDLRADDLDQAIADMPELDTAFTEFHHLMEPYLNSKIRE